MEPNSSNRLGDCSFELEICYVPSIGRPRNSADAATPTRSVLKNGTLKGRALREGEREPDPGVRSACIGIRRKRLKGDAWCYKKVCEQVLALTATELRRPIESSV